MKASIETSECTVTSRRLICPADQRAYQHDAAVRSLGHAGRAPRPNSRRKARALSCPSGEKLDVEGAIEPGGRGRASVEHTVLGAEAGALLGGIFGGGKGAGIGSVIMKC